LSDDWGIGLGANPDRQRKYHQDQRRILSEKWMLELCDVMLEFYPKEIGKIHERVDYFKRVKRHWETKSES
jgi:hypothetical protein